jgi:hypothetical protein
LSTEDVTKAYTKAPTNETTSTLKTATSNELIPVSTQEATAATSTASTNIYSKASTEKPTKEVMQLTTQINNVSANATTKESMVSSLKEH